MLSLSGLGNKHNFAMEINRSRNKRWCGVPPAIIALVAFPCLAGNHNVAFAFTASTKLKQSSVVHRSLLAGRHLLRMSANPVTPQLPSLHVSIDQPLILENLSPVASKASRSPTTNIKTFDWNLLKKSLLGLLKSEVFRTTVMIFSLFMVLSLITRSLNNTRPDDSGRSRSADPIRSFFTAVLGRIGKVRDLFRTQTMEEGKPMLFDYSSENDGWGVCSLRAKRRLGKSSFVQYEFDLPQPDYVLPLDLGQRISLCCLDDDDNVAKGDFFPYSVESSPTLGTFSILAPNRTPLENEFAIGDDAANFVRVLKQDLRVGDEVALKPGDNRLEYRGQYLPVTDMLYVACGTGIAPVMDQVRAVLPDDVSSSVKSVTVVWINESTRDFDVTADQLEKVYLKYSNKLAVSCIVDDLTKRERTMEDNSEIYDAVPDFKPGTMAVLSGPAAIMDKAAEYLERRGYPADCICIL